MNRFQTSASKAEKEIRELLTPEEYVYRPWQLIEYEMKAITLITITEEIQLLYDKPAFLRPGFEVKDRKVYIPNMIVKYVGNISSILPNYDIKSLNQRNLTKCYKSIQEFNELISNKVISDDEIKKILNADGLIEKNKLYRSEIYNYNYLRKKYQDLLVDKINYLIKNRESIFDKRVDTENIYTVIATLLNIEEDIIMLLHNFDFQYQIPSIIIFDEEQTIFTNDSAYIIALLKLLGFDIMIISSKGFSNIELILRDDLYDVHYENEWINKYDNRDLLSKTKKKNKFQKYKKSIIIVTALVLTIAGICYIYNKNYEKGEEIFFNYVENKYRYEEEYGEVIFDERDRYNGDYKDGMKHGYGTMYFYNGDKYTGEWKKDNIEGYGIMYFASGDKYEGQWKNNKMHGKGTLYFDNGCKYEGEWVNNFMEGKGKVMFQDGSWYEGEFKHDMYHGIGRYYGPDGTLLYDSIWENGNPRIAK